MPPAVLDGAAVSLRSVADSVTSAVVAVLSLTGVAVLLYGLIRAVLMNRRIQVVVADLIAPPGDAAEFADAAILSPVLRQLVEHDVNDQREQTERIGRVILSPASRELELTVGSRTIEHVQRAATDSVAALSAALRAVTPDQADRFLGLFSIILPPPRGLNVAVVLLRRGAAEAPRLGASIDITSLSGRPEASAVFWEPVGKPSASASAQPGGTERILTLLEPVARWIAVRLVVTLMVSPRRRVTSSTRQGLARLLAGGLFLAAMRDFSPHALAFGEQARAELERARVALPDIPLPLTTLAGVRERMGLARRADANPHEASDDFRVAVELWQEAESLMRQATASNEAKLAETVDRRLKAQIESGDPALRGAALAELRPGPDPAGLQKNRVWLYNRSCLYAQASEAVGDAGYQKQALRYLGLALVRDHDSKRWDYAARDDPELAPIRPILDAFLPCLQGLIAQRDPGNVSDADAAKLVDRAVEHAANAGCAGELMKRGRTSQSATQQEWRPDSM